jgi:LysM repeat protein
MVIWRKVKSLKGFLLVGLAGLVVAGGCTPSADVSEETDERAYRRGKSLLREGRKDEALQAFLAVISSRSDAAESNLEAGLIYLNHIKDPLAAIYHFRGYLALNPEGEHAGFVKELIQTAQKDFAQSLPGNPFEDTIDRVNLMETVKDLQAENQRLKEQVLQLQKEATQQESEILRYREALAQRTAQARQQPGEVAPIVIAPAETDAGNRPAQTPDSYTVQAGDTLSRISDRVYGTSGRWMDIFQANRDQLPSPNALKPGQVLRIP